MTHVRTATKVNEGAAAVYGGGGCGYLLVQNPELELVVLEERRRGGGGEGDRRKRLRKMKPKKFHEYSV